MVDGRDYLRRNRDLLAAVRERHHVGDARGSVKYKHEILLVPYRKRRDESYHDRNHTLPLDGI
jgi:hypothetical protein